MPGVLPQVSAGRPEVRDVAGHGVRFLGARSHRRETNHRNGRDGGKLHRAAILSEARMVRCARIVTRPAFRSVSILVPAFNEAATIETLVDRVVAAPLAPDRRLSKEII